MNQAALKENNILDTSVDTSASNWDHLLKLQTEMFLPYEIQFLLNSLSWQRANSVLDVGCGNGAYISQVSDYFPEKSFTAIDISPELISVANIENTKTNVEFYNASLDTFQTENPFDLIIMRLVVQHLSDFKTVLSKAEKLLKPGGHLLIIEPDLENCWSEPTTPKFDQLMLEVDQRSVQDKTNRCLLTQLGDIAETTNQWNKFQEVFTTAPFIGPFADSKLLNLYLLWIDIIEQGPKSSSNLQTVRDEISSWAEKNSSYSQIGIRFLLLEKLT